MFWLVNLLFYGFGEEIGWRGFTQPTLGRRHSALHAALVVSVIWATTTPTTTALIPTVMGAAITVAALAVIPSLWRAGARPGPRPVDRP